MDDSRSGCARHKAEIRGKRVALRTSELSTIEYVEEFNAELQAPLNFFVRFGVSLATAHSLKEMVRPG